MSGLSTESEKSETAINIRSGMVYRFSIFRPAQDSLEAFGSGCLLCVSESQFVSGIFKKAFFARKTGRNFANIAFAGSVSRKGQTQTLFLHPIAELPRRCQFQSFSGRCH